MPPDNWPTASIFCDWRNWASRFCRSFSVRNFSVMSVTMDRQPQISPPASRHGNRITLDVAPQASIAEIIEPFKLPMKMVHLVLINGVYVPLYGVNNALGAIPLFGALLTGGQNEGMFAINYRASGSTSCSASSTCIPSPSERSAASPAA